MRSTRTPFERGPFPGKRGLTPLLLVVLPVSSKLSGKANRLTHPRPWINGHAAMRRMQSIHGLLAPLSPYFEATQPTVRAVPGYPLVSRIRWRR